ncbi:unnamed protein product [Heligmosomoides polygyrus]|uniref:CUB domain-containing protein n=1 Tax=Heligmosomoides polygyrus TaxID=6339 RepID=A0A3P7XJI1_HELPZ|nr:unnamed protein product [Heligmosomoides polygyrus]
MSDRTAPPHRQLFRSPLMVNCLKMTMLQRRRDERSLAGPLNDRVLCVRYLVTMPNGDHLRGRLGPAAASMCLNVIALSSARFSPLAQLLLFFSCLIFSSCAQSTCSGATYLNVTRAKQYLSTPFYGSANYPPNMNCYYVLKADPESRILVELLDVDMEAQLFRSCLDFVGFHEAFGECDAGWLSRDDGMCYRHVQTLPKVGWADAQEQCGQMQANLASIRNEKDYEYMSRSFGHSSGHSWIGYTDADQEGTLMDVNLKATALYPFRLFLILDLLDWSTIVAGPQHLRVRTGSKATGTNYTIWLLILVALVLLIIVLCIICQACMKKREQNRVHSTESNRLVRGLEATQSHSNAVATKDQQSAQVNYHRVTEQAASEQPKTVQLSPVQADVHADPTESTPSALPNLVDESNLRLKEQEKEQKDQTLSATIAVPSAQPPRSLPPLSIRETTLQSINTREESFLRSKRTSELFDRPKMNVLENVSAISLDEFWSNTKD